MTYAAMNSEEQKNLIKSYFDREIEVMKRLNIDEINAAVQAVWAAYEREAVIYIFGNGGSSATASHFASDFNKGISENKEKKFRFVCLSDNVPMMMAVANDFSYDDVFRVPLMGRLRPTDLVIGISGSGNSKNVIRAVEYAKEVGAPVVGITGYHGGRLRELADYHMDVMDDDMQISEDLHMVFDHMMYFVLNHE